MKKSALLITMILLSSCMGKMRNIKLSAEDVIFTSEASSYIVTSEIDINIDFVSEDDDPSFYVMPVDEYNLRYEGNWITVTNRGNAILIEAIENTSGKTRTASISLRGKSDPNRAGDIKVIQYGENPLVDTSWKCEQDNSELRFQDNRNGEYIWMEEDVFQSYSFSYDYTDNHIAIKVVFPSRIFEMAGEVDNDTMTFGGQEIQLIYRRQ